MCKVELKMRFYSRIPIIDLPRDLDFGIFHKLMDEIERRNDLDEENLIIDFTRVRYFESSNVSFLSRFLSTLQTNRLKIALVCVTPELKKLFHFLGFTRSIRMFPSEEEALNCALGIDKKTEPILLPIGVWLRLKNLFRLIKATILA